MNTNRKYLLSLTVIFILLALQVVAKDFDDKQYKFKISIPDNWKSNIAMDGTDKVYDFLSQDEMAFIQLRSFKADAGLSLDLLAEVYKENYLPKGCQKIELINKTSVNGIPGKNGTYLVSDNGLDIGISVFYAIQKGQGYAISVIIPTSMTDYYEKDVRSILNSFVIPGYERKSNIEETSSGLGGLARQESGLGGISDAANNGIEPFRGVEILNVRMGDALSGKTNLLNQTTRFNPQTENIYIVFDWVGEAANGHTLTIAWIFDQNGYKIAESLYEFPGYDANGSSNAFLSKPNDGWPLGNYHVEFSIVGQIIHSESFVVTDNTDNQNAWGENNSSQNISQNDEKILFEGSQVKGKVQIIFDYDNYDEPDAKPKKIKAKKGDISGRYVFYKRSDGRDLLNYWYLDFNKDGTYVDEHELKEGNYRTGHEGTWSVDGDLLTTKHISGSSSGTYKIKGNELISQGGDVTMYFKKN